MGGLIGSGGSSSTNRFTSLQVQTSSAGLPIPIVWGTVRVAPNLLWYGRFQSQADNSSGGGKAGSGSGTFKYSCAVAMGLGEGPYSSIGRVWADKTDTTLSKVNLTLFTGTGDQQPMQALYLDDPTQALGYAWTAYVASSNYALGNSPNLPNHNFEVQTNAVPRTGFDANPADILVDFLTNERYGVGVPAEYIGDLTSWRTYCTAMGFFMSPLLDTQEAATDIISRWAQLTNTAIYWDGGKLQARPYGDEPVTGNGVTWDPGQTLAPQYDITIDDVLSADGGDPIQVTRSDPLDAYNIGSLEFIDRSNSYQTDTASDRDQAAIDMYGERVMDAVQGHEFKDAATATLAIKLILRRQLYVRNTFAFKLPARYALLEEGDVITLTSAKLKLAAFPVLITKRTDAQDKTLSFEAEEMPAGIGTATAHPHPASSNTPLNTDITPGDVSQVVIMEPSPGLSGGVQQVWIGAAGGTWWGGAAVWISVDDENYQRIGQINGPCRIGVLANALPAAADPDTTDTPQVTLATNRVELGMGTTVDADAGRTLCLIGNEMVAYATATLTGTNTYRLSYLRRGMYGTSVGAHAAATAFARLDDRLFSYDLPAAYVGQRLYIKLTSFNIFQSAELSLADVGAYTYTPVGAAGMLPAPTGLTLSVVTAYQADGTVAPAIAASWTAADAGSPVDTILRWAPVGTTDWQTITVPAGTTSAQLAPVTQGTKYQVQAASRLSADVRSVWAPIPAATIAVGGVLDGASVTGLELYGQGLDTEFKGRDIHLVWQGNFPATSYSLGSEPYGTGSGFVNPYFQAYAVTVIEPDSGAVLRTDLVTDPEYFYLFDSMNAKDAGGPHRRLTFRVAIRDKLGGETDPATITVSNPAPPAVSAQVRQGVGTIVVDIPAVTDRDLAGYVVWVNGASGFDPNATEPTYQGLLNLIVLPVALGTYYVRAAAYDAFGTAGLNIAGEIPITVEDVVLDVTPPAIPTGLALTSSTSITPAGDALTVLKAAWNASPSANFASFDVAIRQGTGGEIVYPTTTPSYQWTVTAATAYSVRVRARSKSDIASDYCAPVSATTAGDTVPPGACAALTVLAGLRALYLSWTNPGDSDLAGIEVWASSTNDRAAAVRVTTVMSTAFTHTGLAATQTLYYWLRAVDTSGNAGPYFPASATAGVSGTVAQAVSADFAPASVGYTKFASGIEPVGIVSSLPSVAGYSGPSTVLLTTDGQLYRLSGGVWTASVPAVNVSGQLTDDQLAAIAAAKLTGTITSTQIADDSISTPKLQAGSISSAKIATGAIIAEKIDAGAVTTKKLDANAVTAEKIAANTITADQIAANTITSAVIKAGAISTTELAAGAITTEKIAANTIKAGNIASSTITAEQIATGTLTAEKIKAQTLTGELFSPSTYLPSTITVDSGGVKIGTVKDTANSALATASDAQSKANNPAVQVNANTTLISPGKIQLFGTTTLSSWQKGGDETRIDGGSISANTISANKLTIGNRGIQVDGLGFTADKSTNTLSWGAGTIVYTNDSGSSVAVTISAGSVTFGGMIVFVYWTKGATALSTSTDITVAITDNTVVMCSYTGSANISATYGQTIIDGANIRTGTVTANLISTEGLAASVITSGTFRAVLIPDLDAKKITTGTLGASVIYGGTINADQINSGSIGTKVLWTTATGNNDGSAGVYIDGQNRNVWTTDGTRTRTQMGYDGSDYGIRSWDSTGRKLFDSNDLGVGVASGIASVSAYQDGSSVTASTKGAWTTITSVPAFQVRGNPCDIKVSFSASVAVTGSGGAHAYSVRVQVLRTNTRTGATSTIPLTLTTAPYQGFASDGAFSDPSLDTYTYTLQAWRPADIVGGGDSGGTIVYDAWQFSGVTLQVRWFR